MTKVVFRGMPHLLPHQQDLKGWREHLTRQKPWQRGRSGRCWGQGWRPSRPCGWSLRWTPSSCGWCCLAAQWPGPWKGKCQFKYWNQWFLTSKTEWKESARRSITDLRLEWLNTAWLCPWLCPSWSWWASLLTPWTGSPPLWWWWWWLCPWVLE